MDGIYNVSLGELEPIEFLFLNAKDRYLEVRISGEALGPRQRIVSVPFTLKAEGEVPEGGIILGEQSGDTVITGLGYSQQGDTISSYYLYKKNAYNSSQPRVPQRIAYQGRVFPADGGTVGSEADFTFTIYDADTAGSVLWTEAQNNVPLSDGLFSVELGANNPIYPTHLSQKDVWLEMNVNGEALLPRQKIGSVAYALRIESPVPDGGIVLSGDSNSPDLAAKKFTPLGASIDGYYLYEKDAFWALDASVPLLINYQGRLTDETGTPIASDTVDFGFLIYESLSGTNLLWSETITGVTINNGIYDLLLGSGSTITPETLIGPDAFLEIKIIQGSTVETLSPRQRITSVPFSLQAEGTMPGSAAILGDTVDDPNLLNAGFQMSGDTINGYYVYTKTDVDKISPNLAIVQPADTITTSPAIQIKITYSDSLSGIDIDSLLVYHNDVDITSSLSIGDTAATGSVTGSEGGNVFNVWISDNAGNTSFDSALVLLELGTPPTITIISPQDGETVYTNTPYFRVEFYDTGAGVDLNTLVILLNGQTITSSFDIYSGLAQWQPLADEAFSNGSYNISASISDNFGNNSLWESHDFNVFFNYTNPEISSIDPDLTIGGDIVTIYGTGFSNTVGDNNVYFTGTLGGVTAKILTPTPTWILAEVPGSAVSGNVWVDSPGQNGDRVQSNGVPFTLGLPYAYITNRGNHKVAIMDYRDNEIIDAVTIPGSPKPWAVDITPDGHYAFVANYSTHDVTIIDTLTNSIVNTVPLRCAGSTPTKPRAIAISPDGSRAFVANDNRFISEIEIRKALDGNTCQAVQNQYYADGNKFYDIDFTPDGQRAIVAARGDPGYVLGINSRRYYMTDANSNSHYLDHTPFPLGQDPAADLEPKGTGMLPQRIQITSPANPWWAIIVNNGTTSDPIEHSVILTLPTISHRDTVRTDPPGFPSDTCTQGVDAAVSNLGERAFITFRTSANIGVTGLLEATTTSINDVLTVTEKCGSSNTIGCPCPSETCDCFLNKLVYTPYLDKIIATVFWTSAANSRIIILDADTATIPINSQVEIPASAYTCITGGSTIYQPEGIAVWPHFDRDGDEISDLIEARNQSTATFTAFDLRPTVYDRILSFATGAPNSGTLVGGILLPEEGMGYRHAYGTDDPNHDCWGTLRMIRIIEQVGREWNLRHKEGPRITILDMSQYQGGRFRPHASHQNGLDSDVRYLRNDGSEGPFDFDDPVNYPVVLYDDTATQELINLFCDAGVKRIFADSDSNLVAPHGGCTISDPLPAGTHSNHFHIRIIDWP